MNPEYFMGYLPESGPILPLPLPASQGIAARRAEQSRAPNMAGSFRKRPRKQHMKTYQEMEVMNRVLDARKEAEKRKREVAAAQLARQQAILAVDEQRMAAEAKMARQHRQEALAEKQAAKARKLQQAEALEATRAAAKAAAAAARRAAVDALALKVEQQGQAHLARFVRVPNADLPCLNVASSTRIKGSSGGRPVLQKGPRAPSTPAKKATRAVPTSSTSSGSVEEALRHCHCCFSTETPTWRRGGLQPYEGQQLCNACGMWEQRKGLSLEESNKVDMYKEDYLAKQGRFEAACEEVGMCVEGEQGKGSLLAAEQQGSAVQHMAVSHGYNTRSARAGTAATCLGSGGGSGGDGGGGGGVVQLNERQESSFVVGQRMQQSQAEGGCDEGSATKESPKAGRKRSAGDSLLQRAAKKRAGADAVPSYVADLAGDGRGANEGTGSSAAGAGGGVGISSTVVDEGRDTAQQRRVLRVRIR